MNNVKVAAAVAIALGGGLAGQSAFALTAAQCTVAPVKLYVAGSSAAQPSFATALAADLFDTTNGETTFSAPAVANVANGNFKAYCGTAKAGNGAHLATGTVVLVHYRGEGGSVVGALPVVSNKPVKFLDLSATSCQTGTAPSVTGLSANVGTTDGWTGCVTTHAVEMGVTDLEPGVFIGQNYPVNYSTTVFGTATPAQLGNLTTTPLFQQVFGLFINTNGLSGGGVAQAVDLSRETVANILAGNISDWSQVPTVTGGHVSTTSPAPITLVNREAGSGTRSGASIYFLETNCSANGVGSGVLSDPNPTLDGFATGDVLNTVSATPGGITYASIDNNNGTHPNLTLASLSGVAPSNLAATSGSYDWWFEATAVQGAPSTSGAAVYNWLIGGELANVATAPHVKDILAIPNNGTNVATVPVVASTVGGTTIYINPFTRGGNSCQAPGAAF
jgi:ABC-type phosphate transport system substrate-binding protein